MKLYTDTDQTRYTLTDRIFVYLILLSALSVTGCASLPTDYQRTPTYTLEDTSETKLHSVIQPLVEAHPDKSGFHALSDGIDAFAARVMMVQAAQKSIDVQYYIWHDDLTGRVLHNQLLAAADRGVRVRMLLDDMDTAGKHEVLHIIDAHPNIEVRLFNPFAGRGSRIGDYLTDARRINHRMHNKTITADNQATIFGGRNIGDEYFDASGHVGFSDLDAFAIGPVVDEVSRGFDLYWNSQWVYPLAAFKPGEAVTEEMINRFREQSDAYIEEARSSKYAAAIRQLDIVNMTGMEEMDFTWGRWVLVYDHPSKVEATEITEETHLGPKLRKAMDKAQDELIIVSPYFVPGSNFTEYLVGLVDRGVRVRIMTNSLAANDVPMVHAGYQRYREALISGGVELYEFKPIKHVGIENEDVIKQKKKWMGSSRASLHGKYFGFDQRYIFIGSFNLDARSVVINTELGAYFESPEYGTLLAKAFDETAMTKGYRVLLNDDNELEWVTLEAGKEVRFDVEPETSFWKRFSTDFLSIFVPESQL
jgi:putative cardiolipin synthase